VKKDPEIINIVPFNDELFFTLEDGMFKF